LASIASASCSDRGESISSAEDGASQEAQPGSASAAAALALSAPSLDRSIVTTTAAQMQHWHSGPAPEQTGVTAGAIDATLAAGLTGVVFDRDSGLPIVGASIGVVAEPGLGSTSTLADGSYRMVVNGGRTITLDIQAPGYLPGQRKVTVPPLNYFTVPKLALVAEPVLGTVASRKIAFATRTPSGRVRAATGSRLFRSDPITDADGTRRVSMFFPRATQGQVRPKSQTMMTIARHGIRTVSMQLGFVERAERGNRSVASATRCAWHAVVGRPQPIAGTCADDTAEVG
jgi:hypothetical protein